MYSKNYYIYLRAGIDIEAHPILGYQSKSAEKIPLRVGF